MKRFARKGRAWACMGIIVTMISLSIAAHAAENAQATAALQLTRVGSMPASAKPTGVPDDYVVTPNGYFSPDCVATVHEGDRLQKNGLIQHASGVTEKVTTCGKANYTLQGDRIEADGRRTLRNARTPPPEQSGWVQAANYASSKPIGRIVATWTVPTAPATKDDQVIYFFPGLEQLPNVQSILQPVLG